MMLTKKIALTSAILFSAGFLERLCFGPQV